jgi:hypothetical protein
MAGLPYLLCQYTGTHQKNSSFSTMIQTSKIAASAVSLRLPLVVVTKSGFDLTKTCQYFVSEGIQLSANFHALSQDTCVIFEKQSAGSLLFYFLVWSS